MSIISLSQIIDVVFRIGLPMLIAIAAIAGLVLVLTTRADAFDAADRKSKGIWAGMLGGSAFFLGFPGIGWMMLGIPIIAGMVITGIYWMDVRPQIKGILDNAQGGW
ncbi:DUF2516 family protein [uncultured Corynebacterium sp.]|uniref:DUF2516 family protein n=1 Tax=uncultured Corynebacterium sp. TaxID=159447 RepID=UPI0025E78A0D|nr:DUF2516 family protein [uncultured Corynebacterium sp.]